MSRVQVVLRHSKTGDGKENKCINNIDWENNLGQCSLCKQNRL